MKLNIQAGVHNKGVVGKEEQLEFDMRGNQWSANVWEETSMTLAETFWTDVRERAEEPWGQTGEGHSNQSKKHLRY